VLDFFLKFSYNIDGWWSRYTDCEDYYEEVKQAGLEALEND
jgi:hypothetical protein